MKRNSTQFLQTVKQAIDAKAASAGFYTALHGALEPGSEAAPVLRRIAEDEERNLRGLSDLYRSRMGRRYDPDMKRIPFHSVRHGYQMALRESLASQDRYHEMLKLAPSSEAREFLRQAHGDGIGHALWLLYLLQGLPVEDEAEDGELYRMVFPCRRDSAIAADSEGNLPPPFQPMVAMPPDRMV